MKFIRALLILASITWPAVSNGEESFDFALIASDCKSTVSFLKLNTNSLQLLKADKPNFFCKRNSKVITCRLTYQDSEQKEEIRKYTVISDAPPMLLFSAESNSELTMVNTSELAGAYTSRIFDDKYMGYKVCSMTFMTQDQIKALSNKKN
ncbi:MAG: hypothetical protein IPK77_11805 [Cellvibrio sp.]|nr:hypothetical protein [Cellvibrio sp.]